MAKSFDPKAKAKRQKIIAAVGGVLLLGLLAFQVPRTMKMLNQSSASASDSSSSTVSVTVSGPIAAPSLSGGNATASATSVAPGGLNDPSEVSTANSGQLLAFSRFRTKDPFAQQVNVACASADSSDSSSSSTCESGSGSKPSTGSTSSPSSGGSTGGGTTTTPTQPAASATTAVISVNGSSEEVKVGGKFPSSNPTFVLVSLTKTTAKVGIAGGSLEGQKQTVTLTKGKPLTLMNTADGTRYVLRLVAVT